jgi:membrane protein required for beta-lactamase induction
MLAIKISPLRRSASQATSGLSDTGIIADTRDMITKNIGMLLLAIYLIAVGILTLTGLGIGIITGVLALLAGIFILIGR